MLNKSDAVTDVIIILNSLCNNVKDDVCSSITCQKCPITCAIDEIRKMKRLIKGEENTDSAASAAIAGSATGYNPGISRSKSNNGKM